MGKTLSPAFELIARDDGRAVVSWKDLWQTEVCAPFAANATVIGPDMAVGSLPPNQTEPHSLPACSEGALTDTTIVTVDHGCSRLVSLSCLSYRVCVDSTKHSLLPKPINAPVVSDDDDDEVRPVQSQQQAGPSQAVVIRQAVPPYGQRRGWKPTSLEDFGAWALHCLICHPLWPG